MAQETLAQAIMDFKQDQNFLVALPFIFKHEGGYNNDVCDSGGATNWGISLRFLEDLPVEVADIDKNGIVNWEDVKKLSKEEASELYYTYFWLKSHADKINDNVLAIKYVDMAVNMGITQAAILLQKAYNALAQNKILATDGVIGAGSLQAINNFSEKTKLVEAFKGACQNFYYHLVEIKPQNKKFINGWLSRVNDMEIFK